MGEILGEHSVERSLDLAEKAQLTKEE